MNGQSGRNILSNTILAPLVALVLWTFVMWAWLYATRLPAMFKGRIVYDPHKPVEEFQARLPATVRWKADNYNHLLEQPTLFYAVRSPRCSMQSCSLWRW
jgi:hypothetical protein